MASSRPTVATTLPGRGDVGQEPGEALEDQAEQRPADADADEGGDSGQAIPCSTCSV